MGRLGRVDLSIKVTPVDNEKEIDRDLVDKTKIIYKSSKGIKKVLKNVKYTMMK